MSTTPSTTDATTSTNNNSHREAKQTNDPNYFTKIQSLLHREANYTIPPITTKRQSYLSWDEYFMSVSILTSFRSKDPKSQRGACIVNPQKRIIGLGYNGFPIGCSDDVLPWEGSDDEREFLHCKNAYMVHAEMNAILNKCSADVVDGTMYTAYFPCNECAKMIVQSGITEIVYLHEYNAGDERFRASRILLEMANIRIRKMLTNLTTPIVLNLVSVSSPTTTTATNYAAAPEKKQNNQVDPSIHALLQEEANYTIPAIAKKRKDYLSWDDYFISLSLLSAQRSKDPNTQVGACIVSPENLVIATGYNGFPSQCPDDYLPWNRTAASKLHTKYPYVCHAEVNAILNKCADLKNSRIYVALFPCNECAKVIIQSGIKEVIYLSDKYHDSQICAASRLLFKLSGVKCRQYASSIKKLTIPL